MSSVPDLPREAGELRDAVLRDLREGLWALADEVTDVGPGWLARTPSLPDVWALNQLHITRPASAGEIIALADEHQAGLRFRHIRVEPEAAALELSATLSGASWKADREVLMALDTAAARQLAPEPVVELNEAQVLVLMRRWFNEDFPGMGPATLEQLDEFSRREGRLWGERAFGILDESGLPVSITKLRSHRPTVWVEDVYTVPEARNRGFARTLVTYVAGLARTAGHDLIFIIADDNDWPKHLYESIGFRPIGLTWTFHRAHP